MRVTVREIARQAGVSPATVSLVLNNKKGVSPKTRQHVQQLLKTQGYQRATPRRHKQSYRLGIVKYRAHGMAVEENQGFIASIVDQMQSECRRLSHTIVMRNCDDQDAMQTIAEINLDPVDGIILIGTELPREPQAILQAFKAPLVVLDNSMQYAGWDSVVMDNFGILKKAVCYLHSLGHREIGYLRSNRQISNLDERYAGYLEAMAELGLSVPPPTMLDTTLNGAYLDMRQLLEQGAWRPRGAVVADNDSIAIGAAKAIQEAGYELPRDLSIIGVDDIPYSTVMTPALSTIRVSRSTMGIMAVDLIQKRLQHPDWPAVHVLIDGTLIERSSTCCYNGEVG